MASETGLPERPPEALLEARQRLRAAERRGVDVADAKRLLVRALLAFRERRLDEMGEALRAASRSAEEGERGLREERLRRQLWAFREGGAAPERLAPAETALAQRNLEEAEAALAAVRTGPPRPRRRLIAGASVASLSFESRCFQVLVAEASSGGVGRLLDVRRGEAPPEGLEAAITAALRALRPRPSRVHVALPQEAHVLAPVSLPPLPPAERPQAVRWKLAKLCDFPDEGARVAVRPLGSPAREGGTLGLMARRDALQRIHAMVARAGLPLGRILPPGEGFHHLLPPAAAREARALLEIGRDTAHVFVFGPGGLSFSRDLGVGTSLWLSALETPISSTRGTVRLSDRQAREVLDRFDISASDNLVLEDGTSLNDKDLHSLLRPVLERLQDALSRSLEFAAGLEGGLRVAQVQLCGEGASLPGLDRALSARTGLPVRGLDLSARLPSRMEGLSLLSADARAAGVLLAAQDVSGGSLDLAPASAGVEAALARAARPVLAAGLLLAASLLALSALSRQARPDLGRRAAEGDQQIRDLDARIAQCTAALSVPPRPASPAGESPAATVLRELTLALPPEGAIQSLSLALLGGDGPVLLLEAAAQPDLAPALSRSPLLGRVSAEPLAGGRIRYRCLLSGGGPP